MHLQVKNRVIVPALMSVYVGENPSIVSPKGYGFFKKNCSKIGKAYLDSGGMHKKKVNGHHFSTSFPTMVNKPVNNEADSVQSRKVEPLHAKSRINAD